MKEKKKVEMSGKIISEEKSPLFSRMQNKKGTPCRDQTFKKDKKRTVKKFQGRRQARNMHIAHTRLFPSLRFSAAQQKKLFSSPFAAQPKPERSIFPIFFPPYEIWENAALG